MNATLSGRLQVSITAAFIATAIAFIGFWPTYFGPMFFGMVDTTRLIHLHAAVQVSWLALFIAQIVLAGTGRLSLHMKVGRWVMVYDVVLLLFGLAVSFETFGRHVAMNQAAIGQRRLFGFLRDILFIGAFLSAGWIYRDKPEIHKRLMFVTAVLITLPAVGRMTFLGTPVPLWKFMLVWPLPVYLLIIYDYTKTRVVHPVFVVGLVAMLIMRLVLPMARTDTWMTISSWFVPFYQ